MIYLGATARVVIVEHVDGVCSLATELDWWLVEQDLRCESSWFRNQLIIHYIYFASIIVNAAETALVVITSVDLACIYLGITLLSQTICQLRGSCLTMLVTTLLMVLVSLYLQVILYHGLTLTWGVVFCCSWVMTTTCCSICDSYGLLSSHHFVIKGQHLTQPSSLPVVRHRPTTLHE